LARWCVNVTAALVLIVLASFVRSISTGSEIIGFLTVKNNFEMLAGNRSHFDAVPAFPERRAMWESFASF